MADELREHELNDWKIEADKARISSDPDLRKLGDVLTELLDKYNGHEELQEKVTALEGQLADFENLSSTSKNLLERLGMKDSDIPSNPDEIATELERVVDDGLGPLVDSVKAALEGLGTKTEESDLASLGSMLENRVDDFLQDVKALRNKLEGA